MGSGWGRLVFKHCCGSRSASFWSAGSGSGTGWKRQILKQCCLSGSARIRIHFGRLDPDPHWEYGSGSRRAKRVQKSVEISGFEVPDVLYWGMKTSPVARTSFMKALGYVNCNFWSKKYEFFLAVNFPKFLVMKSLDLDPDPHWN